jgi:hypothetical protein
MGSDSAADSAFFQEGAGGKHERHRKYQTDTSRTTFAILVASYV